jgi:hypothetical protein
VVAWRARQGQVRASATAVLDDVELATGKAAASFVSLAKDLVRIPRRVMYGEGGGQRPLTQNQ